MALVCAFPPPCPSCRTIGRVSCREWDYGFEVEYCCHRCGCLWNQDRNENSIARIVTWGCVVRDAPAVEPVAPTKPVWKRLWRWWVNSDA